MARSAIRLIGIFAGGVVLVGSVWVFLLGRGGTAKQPSPGEAGAPALYREHCARCHGEAGRGDGPDSRFLLRRLLDFTDRQAMAKLTDEYLALIIKNGGDLLGKPGMPAYRTLSDAEIQALVEYLRRFSQSDSSPAGKPQ